MVLVSILRQRLRIIFKIIATIKGSVRCWKSYLTWVVLSDLWRMSGVGVSMNPIFAIGLSRNIDVPHQRSTVIRWLIWIEKRRKKWMIRCAGQISSFVVWSHPDWCLYQTMKNISKMKFNVYMGSMMRKRTVPFLVDVRRSMRTIR